MPITITTCTPEHLPALQEIEYLCFDASAWKVQDYLRYTCAVALTDGVVAGAIVVHCLPEAEAEILNLAVHPAYRRSGIATALLTHVLARSGSTLFLEVRESNRAALALYQKFGFREIGHRANYYNSPDEAAIVMRLQK